MSEVEQSDITNYFCLPLLKTRNTRCDDHSLRLQTRGTRESGLKKKVNPGYHLDLKNLYYVNRKNGVFCDTGCFGIDGSQTSPNKNACQFVSQQTFLTVIVLEEITFKLKVILKLKQQQQQN